MLQEQFTRSDRLGADLRALRKSRGLTLHNLADRLGRSVGWLSQVERNLSEPSIADLGQIASALDVDVTSLSAPKQQRKMKPNSLSGAMRAGPLARVRRGWKKNSSHPT